MHRNRTTESLAIFAFGIILIVGLLTPPNNAIFAGNENPKELSAQKAIVVTEGEVVTGRDEADKDAFVEADYYDPFVAAAETIGIDEDTLWNELDAGNSLADIATANGVEPQALIDALVVEENAFIDELLADGEISEAEAEEWRMYVIEDFTYLVNETDDWFAWEEEEAFIDWFIIAADAIGLTDEEQLWEALDAGQSLADLAVANGSDAQTVIDALVAEENAFIDELLADGDISEAEADEWRSEVVLEAEDFVNASGTMLLGVDWFGVAAETIGLDDDALWDAIDNGQSIAEIAEANGSSAEAVTAAILQAEQAFIDELLVAGDITTEEADRWRAELAEELEYFVNDSFECLDEEA